MVTAMAAGVEDAEGKPLFMRHGGPGPTRHLYIVNCGPAVGVTWDKMARVLASFGTVESILPAGDGENRAFVSFETESGAAAARNALREMPVDEFGGRAVKMEFAQLKQKAKDETSGCHIGGAPNANHLCVNGLTVIPDFVTPELEQELLAAVDAAPWQRLAKRRVQHYGYEFQYKIRTVDPAQPIGPLPDFLSPVLDLMAGLPQLTSLASEEPSLPFNQITVNEYPRGVGLSPHIDTHSAFEGAIVSLSLAGPCIFELRRDPVSKNLASVEANKKKGSCGGEQEEKEEAGDCNENGDNKQSIQANVVPVYLPRRSLLIMSGEARYAWSHYIPHRKGDVVDGVRVPREGRRVSITFRRIRNGPCACGFPEHCDSRQGLRLPIRAPSGQGQGQSKADISLRSALKPGVAAAGPLQDVVWAKLNSAKLPPDSSVGARKTSEDATARQNLSPCPPPPPFQSYPPSSPPPPEETEESPSEDSSADVAGAISAQLAGTTVGDGEAGMTLSTELLEEEAARRANLQLRLQPSATSADSVRRHLSTPEIERRHVHEMYDAIAPHFDATRFARWPKVSLFLGSLAPGSLVLDAGCGNGKYLGLNPQCTFIGCDISPSLVAICQSRGADVAAADTLLLPFREGAFDATISIAVLHHLSSRERRKRAIAELLRVVRKGGRVLLTVWAAEQEDQSLIAKWRPLGNRLESPDPPPPPSPLKEGAGVAGSPRYTEEWVGDDTALAHALSRRESKSDRWQSLTSIAEVQAAVDALESREGEEETGSLEGGSLNEAGVVSMAGGSPPLEGSSGEEGRREGGGEGPEQEFFVPWHLPYHRLQDGGVDSGAVGLGRRDDQKKAVVFERYYHVFVEGELEGLAEEVGGSRLVDQFFDKSNWCIVLEKL